MSRGSRRGRSIEQRADELLRGGRQPTAGELLALIHEVNPTPRALPARVEAERYALKSRLQSLLIRAHADELMVEPGAEGSPDVGLRHRHLGLDACHARIDTLDDDARSWVRLQLDLGIGAAGIEVRSVNADEAVDDSPAGRVRRGRAAIAEYDYEAAETLLRGAFEDSLGAAFAADALFKLLVDTLALDEQALALADALSASAAKQPSLRAALALAAARLGREDESLRWLSNAKGSRAADAAATLARHAITRGDFAQATERIDLLRIHDPAHVELVPLTEAVDRHRAEQEKPLIEARRRERQERERQRQEALAQALRAAKEAEEEGDDARALRCWEAALELEGDVTEALARVRERLSVRAREERILQVAAALDTTVFDPGLLTNYGQLPADERAQVRGLIGSDAARLVDWMEESGLDGTTAKLRAAAEAALELDTARRALEGGRPAEALQLLQHHERILVRIQDARRLAAEANALVKSRTKEVQEREEAERLARAEAEQAANEARRVSAHLTQANAHATAGALLDAQREMRLAMRLMRDEETRLEQQAHLNAWAEQVAEQWGRCVWEGEAPLSELSPFANAAERWASTLLPGGRTWVALLSLDANLFAVEVEVDSGTVSRRLRWRLPRAVEVRGVRVRDGGLWVRGDGGTLFELSWPSGGIRRWLELDALLEAEFMLDRGLEVPAGSPLVWLSDGTFKPWGTLCLDPDTLAVVWEDRDYGWEVQALSLGGRPRLAFKAYHRPCLLRGLDGQGLDEKHWSHDRRLHALTMRPDGAGYVALVSAPERELSGVWKSYPSEEAWPVHLREWSERDPPRERTLPNATTDGASQLATSLDEGLVFACTRSDVDAPTSVFALRQGPSGLEEVWRTQMNDVELLSDPSSRRVVLDRGTGPEGWTVLGPTVPEERPPAPAPQPAAHLPRYYGPMHCGTLTPPREPKEREFLQRMNEQQRRRWLDGLRLGPAPASYLLASAAHFDSMDLLDDAKPHAAVTRELVRLACELHPHDAKALLAEAHARALEGDWAGAMACLERDGSSALSEEEHNHRQHLLGLAKLRAGELQAALAAFRKELPPGETDRVSCGLVKLAAHVEVLMTPLDRLRWEDQPTPERRLTALLRLVDRCIDEGRVEQASDLLGQQHVDGRGELQTAARRAWVALEYAGPGDDRFRRAIWVATFIHLLHEELHPPRYGLRRGRLHLGAWEWDEARLTALAERGKQWLVDDAGLASPAAGHAA